MIGSSATPTKLTNISSATGRRPVTAAPTAAPMKPISQIGVSMTRLGPNSWIRPLVAPMGPPQASMTVQGVVTCRPTLAPVWNTTVGPGSQADGGIGSTASDGTTIYGSDSIDSQVFALNRDGAMRWNSWYAWQSSQSRR